MFAAADKDGDGKLSFEELNAFRHPQTDEATVCRYSIYQKM